MLICSSQTDMLPRRFYSPVKSTDEDLISFIPVRVNPVLKFLSEHINAHELKFIFFGVNKMKSMQTVSTNLHYK